MNSILLQFRLIRLRNVIWPALSAATVLSFAEGAFAQTNAYLVTELSGEDASQVPRKLNNLGDIVGRKNGSSDGSPRATTWSHLRLTSKRLGALSGGDYSSASDINDAGEIVGVSNTDDALVPFLWTSRTGLQRIPLLPGDVCGEASGINRYGHVAGSSSGPNGSRAYLWTRRDGLRNLGILPGGKYSRARAINDLDEVVGVSGTAAGEHAVFWTKTGDPVDLGTLPGDWASEATALNHGGVVVGFSKGPTGMRPFVWTRVGGMEELGLLPGGDAGQALDINDSGEVVGTSTSSLGERAFLWTKQTGTIDLNNASSTQIGVTFFEAHAINNKGQILAMGKMAGETSMAAGSTAASGQVCAPAPPSSFLLKPVNTN